MGKIYDNLTTLSISKRKAGDKLNKGHIKRIKNISFIFMMTPTLLRQFLFFLRIFSPILFRHKLNCVVVFVDRVFEAFKNKRFVNLQKYLLWAKHFKVVFLFQNHICNHLFLDSSFKIIQPPKFY